MRKTDPKTLRLADQPLFWSLSTRELEGLTALFDELRLPVGSVLTRQGFTAGETFLICSGEVSVTIDGEEVARLGAGEVVGEIAVLRRGPRTATVTAVTDISVFVVTPRALSTLAAEPSIAALLNDMVVGRTR